MYGSEETVKHKRVAQVLAQKENDDLKAENENLKAQLDSYQSYDIDMSDIAEELAIVYQNITGAAGGHMSSHSVGSPTTVNGITVVLYENKALNDEQLKTVTELLKKRLDVSNVTVIQQVEKQKDTTSKAESTYKKK